MARIEIADEQRRFTLDRERMEALARFVLASERRTRWLGVGLAACSFAWMFAAVFVIMPRFRPPDNGQPWFYLLRYSHLGRTPGEIALFVVRHPFVALWRSFAPAKLATLAILVVGFGGAPLFGGRRLLAVLPVVTVHYLSARTAQFSFENQYLAEAVPLMAWAAIAGVPWTFERWPRRCASVGILVGVLVGVAPRLYHPDYLPRREHASLRRAVALVPDDAPACATNAFGASLSGRRSFDYCVLFSSEMQQYAFFGWPLTSAATYQVFDLNDADTAPDAARRVDMLRAAGAEVLFDAQPVFVFRVTPEVLARAAMAPLDPVRGRLAR